MSDSNAEYIKLITSEHTTKPKFVAYVKAFLDMCSPMVDCYNDYAILFMLDTAEGDQLDILGELAGITRNLPISGTDIPARLNDLYFRKVIKAKILQNHWDGTRAGLDKIIEQLYPELAYEIVDNQDMSYAITLLTDDLDAVEQALIFNNYILPKPSGVRVSYNNMENKMFGWDSDTAFIAGWDEGQWANS